MQLPNKDARLKFQSTLPMRGATSFTRRNLYQRAKFQSTLPMRGATLPYPKHETQQRHFNPRSPCGERQDCRTFIPTPWYFNPRSPCGERPVTLRQYYEDTHFNPRSPCGERRLHANTCYQTNGISIHAPHAGSDLYFASGRSLTCDFNPRSPCGERQECIYNADKRRYFNPRSPCGERLAGEDYANQYGLISIHAPHAGSDLPRCTL